MDLSAKSVLLLTCFPGLISALFKQVCEQKGEYITCPFGQVVQISKVQYGRTRLGLCNPYQTPNLVTNCYSTAISTNTIKRLCEYRTMCFLQADNVLLGEDPCSGMPKYLEVTYSCVVPTTTTRSTTPTTTHPTTSSTTTTTTTTTTPTTTTTRRRTTPTTRQTTPTTRPTTTPTTTTPTTTSTTPTTTTTTSRPTTTAAPFSPFNAPIGSQICHDYLITNTPGGHLSASSAYGTVTDNSGPERGRLFTGAAYFPNNGTYFRGGWTAGVANQQQYIQVQLNKPSIFRGVATQGRHVSPHDGCCNQHVTKYRVMYSLDCVNFQTVHDDKGNDRIFIGNTDQDSVVSHMLPCSVMARCVRINPLEWKDHIAMRFDLMGCTANTADIGKCPKGWEERPGSNQCYLITDVHDMRTRDDASAQCQLRQGHLVKIDSVAERVWIQQQVRALATSQGQHHFWTGLSNRPRTDSLDHKWTDGTPLDTLVMPWGQGQPDNSGGLEHCAELWDGNMNDNSCAQHYPYICETSKFWKPTRNIPSPKTIPPPATRPTTAPPATRPTTAPPTVVPHNIPVPGGGNVVKIGNNVFTTGCVNQTTGCRTLRAGDYQSCNGCHYYKTCAPSGVFIRPCPAMLVWDDNIKTCSMLSSTCQGP